MTARGPTLNGDGGTNKGVELSLQQPITGGLRRMIAFGHLSALAMLLRQLERGLEEVHEQTRSSVQSGDRLRGGNALESAVAQELAHDSAVLLLDPGLVILSVRSGARKLNLILATVFQNGFINEHRVVIRVEPGKRKRQPVT